MFDHLPESYLDNLDVGGLLDDHLQDIKREMLEEDGRDRAGEDLGEGERDHAVLGSSPVKAEVKEEVAGYSSSEDDEAPLWRGPGFSKPNKLQVKLRARGLKRKRDSGSEDDSWWAGWMAGREEQSLLPTSTPLPGRGEGPRLGGPLQESEELLLLREPGWTI